jgi:hypothetical protein
MAEFTVDRIIDTAGIGADRILCGWNERDEL